MNEETDMQNGNISYCWNANAYMSKSWVNRCSTCILNGFETFFVYIKGTNDKISITGKVASSGRKVITQILSYAFKASKRIFMFTDFVGNFMF